MAAGIALAVCFGLAATVADAQQAQALRQVIQPLSMVTLFWLLTGPVWVMGTKEPKQ
ncbi:hypothetical protein [Nocardia panacis]|uniref:hypothetical protein n=1 Tax=Nocardia panacis TaxID=2340916 RepID=UPI0013156625|nr:hypothetical protein [Nocardia panacis]